MTDDNTIAREFERVRADLGTIAISKEDVLDWAQAHPGSLLHDEFDWCDAAAARQYRLWQASYLLAAEEMGVC
jgi:hypothetical protein